MAFVPDPAREARWRELLVERIAALGKSPTIQLVALPPPCYPEEVAVRWLERASNPAKRAAGEIHWEMLEPNGRDPVDADTWFPDAAEEREAARSLYIFDDHPDSGDGTMVLASADGQMFAHHTKQQSLLPLSVDFVGYVSLMIELVGMSGLIELATNVSGHGRSAGSHSDKHARTLASGRAKTKKAALAAAERLFPDRDRRLIEALG